jgi:hypothetical protein
MKAEHVLLQHESETALDNYKLDYFIKWRYTWWISYKSRILLKQLILINYNTMNEIKRITTTWNKVVTENRINR